MIVAHKQEAINSNIIPLKHLFNLYVQFYQCSFDYRLLRNANLDTKPLKKKSMFCSVAFECLLLNET